MRKCIVSYSKTGNNQALAQKVAESIGAEHISIKINRSMFAMVLDIMFGTKPKARTNTAVIDSFDEVSFAGPIWMGKVASPLRRFLLHAKKSGKPYRFFTISGGSLNSNPGLRSDIIKYGGDKLTKQIEMYKFDLIGNKGATAKDTMDYHLTEADLDMLTKSLADKLA